MKKIIYCVLAIFLLSIKSFPFDENNYSNFIYYLDTRAGEKKLVGIMNVGKGIFFYRIYDMINDIDVTTQLKITNKSNEIEIVPGNTNAENEKQQKLFAMGLTDLFNQAEIFKRQKFDSLDDIFINDPWPEFGYTLKYELSNWIPFFKIKSIEHLEEKNKCYNLVLIGRITDEKSISKFFIKDIPSTDDNGPEIAINNYSTKTEIINSIKVNLDDNWINNELNKNLPQYLKGKHISIKTGCDAQINFEEGDISKFGFDSYEDFVKAYLFIVDNYIYPESIKIQKNGDNYLLYYECIDKKNNIKNISFCKAIKMNGKKYKIINFSCFYNVYIKNKQYFDDIISSCSIK